jgi:hypothetical protein
MSIIALAYNRKQAQSLEEQIDKEMIYRGSRKNATVTSFAWSFYNCIFKLFANIVLLISKTPLAISKEQERTLKELLDKLFL